RKGGRTGGEVAGPVFRQIAEATLSRLGVPPNAPVDEGLVARGTPRPIGPTPVNLPLIDRRVDVQVTPTVDVQRGTMPDVRGLSARDAIKLLVNAGVEPRLSGSGVVKLQSPAAGTVIRPGQGCD